MNTSASAPQRLRAHPAYRRAVWGLRLLVYGLTPLVCIPLLGLAGVEGPVLVLPFGVSIALIAVGIVLAWSAAAPLTRLQHGQLGDLGRLSRATTARRMVLRDAFAWRRNT